MGVMRALPARAITEYVGRYAPGAATMLLDRLEYAANRLGSFPLLGRVVPEYDDVAIRELVVRSYRLIYQVDGDVVSIVAIVHGSRDLARHLPAGPWDIE